MNQARIDTLEIELEEARQEIDRLQGIIRTLRATVATAGKSSGGPLRLPVAIRLSRRMERLVLLLLTKDYLTLRDYQKVYNRDPDSDPFNAQRGFRVHIQTIREALRAAGVPVTVHTVHNVGYKFTPADKAVLLQIMKEGIVIP